MKFDRDLHDGIYGLTIYVFDPDGNMIELYEEGAEDAVRAARPIDRSVLRPILRDSLLRGPPQGEVNLLQQGTTSC